MCIEVMSSQSCIVFLGHSVRIHTERAEQLFYSDKAVHNHDMLEHRHETQ